MLRRLLSGEFVDLPSVAEVRAPYARNLDCKAGTL